MIIAFTGHRPNKLGGYRRQSLLGNKVKRSIYNFLLDKKDQYEDLKIISGMALGVDQWAAQSAICLEIPFIAAIPFEGMETKWPKESQLTFHEILLQADDIVEISEPPFLAWKMHLRNRWMVNNCDELVAYWDGSDGGTANCVNYAQEEHKKITIINPRDL